MVVESIHPDQVGAHNDKAMVVVVVVEGATGTGVRAGPGHKPSTKLEPRQNHVTRDVAQLLI